MHTCWVVVFAALATATSGTMVLTPEPRAANISALYKDSKHNIDKIVDTLMELVRVEVKARGMDQMKLPDFTETFKKKVGFLKVKGEFKGHDGWGKSLSSIKRQGEAVVSTSGGNVALDVPLGFGDLQVGYKYQAKLKRVASVSGNVKATVGSNTVRLRASLVITDSSCSAAVDALDLTDLGKIKVKATGLGPLNFLLNMVANWTTKRMHGKIEDAVQTSLRKAINKAGLKFDCGQL